MTREHTVTIRTQCTNANLLLQIPDQPFVYLEPSVPCVNFARGAPAETKSPLHREDGVMWRGTSLRVGRHCWKGFGIGKQCLLGILRTYEGSLDWWTSEGGYLFGPMLGWLVITYRQCTSEHSWGMTGILSLFDFIFIFHTCSSYCRLFLSFLFPFNIHTQLRLYFSLFFFSSGRVLQLCFYWGPWFATTNRFSTGDIWSTLYVFLVQNRI